MINTSLDKKYTAKEGGQINYDPIPDGEYKLRVKDVDPWKESIKNIKVILRDENGNVLEDEKGNKQTEMVNNCKFYNCMVRFEIVEGQYAGRIIFHNLTTHPNMSWSIDNFLYALGLKELTASEIQTACKGKECIGNVYIDEYEKVTQNKETGLDETTTKKVNRIKSLKPLDTPNQENQEMTNLGI